MRHLPFLATLLVVSTAMTATAEDKRGATEVTVYNGGFALVKQRLVLKLEKGEQEIKVEDVAQMMDPTSVAIRNVDHPGSFTVLEQNYRYDLISVQAILAKAVGSKIALNRTLPNGSTEKIIGTLMSAPYAVVGTMDGSNQMAYNGMVLQTDDGRILLSPSGEVEVFSIPKDLISRPSLVWLLDSDRDGSERCELSYLTNGMSWEASYVLSLEQSGTKGDVKGWVTMNNRSGATFQLAKLKLLAGDVNRVRPESDMMLKSQMRAGAAGRDMTEESFADYHLYTLQRPATLRNNEMKQISLLEGSGVKFNRKLTMIVGYGRYGQMPSDGFDTQEGIKPSIQLSMQNTAENQMGMALPKGVVKVYQRDSSDSLQLIGEDRIDHTPKNEEIKLNLGVAFDIVGTFKRTNFETIRVGNNVRGARSSFSLEVRNRKDTAETLRVLDPQYGQWKVTKSSEKYTKPDASTLQFDIELRANETKVITYTVETTW